MQLAAPTVFLAGSRRAIELQRDDLPALQRFFDENPEYFQLASGRPAAPNAAVAEFESPIPAGWSFTKPWHLGFLDESGTLVAMASAVSDLLAPGVFHLGLFMVATHLHGTGEAPTLFRALETWALQLGSAWLRLGVMDGNLRARRFWEHCGFVEVRQRHGVEIEGREHTIRVLVKPLTGQPLTDYLILVPRDRPD